MKTKKTLFLDSSLRIAGGQQMLLELLSALKKVGLPVIAGVPSRSALTQLLELRGIPVFNNQVQSASYQVATGLKYYTNVIKGFFEISRFVQVNDVQVIYANTFLAAMVGGAVGRFNKIPVVFCDHDIDVHRIFSRLVARLCDQVIVVSKATSQKYSKKYQAKITIIFNGIDPSVYKPGESTSRTQLFGDTRNMIIGYAGRISALKGVDLIPEIARLVTKEIPSVKFWVVGEPFLKQDEGFLNKLRRVIRQDGLEKTIILSEFRTDIIDVIRGFDIVILPSEKDSFGRILIEAMAMGKPVISTRCGGPEEIILDGKTGFLVPKRDCAAISDKLIHLLKNIELIHTLGKNGRQHVMTSFSLDQQVQKFLTVHESVINQHE